MKNSNWPNQFAVGLAFISVLLALPVKALDVINPAGVNYTVISDSSHYDGSYTSANLFNNDMSGVALGTIISGAEYATASQSSSFVAFQLDTVYTNVASLFYAQRNGFFADQDKMGIISIWSSTTTPFTAADPGTPPNSVIAITNSTGAQWAEYLMTNSIAGQYSCSNFSKPLLAAIRVDQSFG